MSETVNQPPLLQRLPSGISGLDRILQGGFFRGGSYILMGPPGAGKTILGNQLCFQHVARGGRALYFTLLAETYSRMLAHMGSMTFYTPTPVGERLHYFSGYTTLEQKGLEGLMSLLRAEVRRLRASLLVIDGAVLVGQTAPSMHEWKRFLHALYVSTEFLGCTTLLLMQSDLSSVAQQAHTMVDGVIELLPRGVDMRLVRQLQVLKSRGSPFLEGWHLYTITEAGLVVYPRTEATLTVSPTALPEPLSTTERPTRMGIGIAQLDAMLGGGLPAGSTTLLLGTAGTGKTLLGYHFLAQGAGQGQNRQGKEYGGAAAAQRSSSEVRKAWRMFRKRKRVSCSCCATVVSRRSSRHRARSSLEACSTSCCRLVASCSHHS